ncbi:hypothetical protein F750_0245 [Streptomyces sp. PAMC 26508]|nr:hypothetical protein F750_0245 [Streptomyces sp. PAMC 26508]
MNKKGNGRLGLPTAPEISAAGSPECSGAQRDRLSSPARWDASATKARDEGVRGGAT